MTRRQLQSGLFRKVLHNVYADPRMPFDHQLLSRGVALLMPAGAALASRSAATWFGADSTGVTDPVTVVVSPTTAWRGPAGVRVHRTDLADGDVQVVEDGVRATSAIRTAWDVATLERLPDAVATLDGMLRAEAVDRAALAGLVTGAVGRWRGQRAQRALTLADGRAESPPESWVRVACHLAGLPAPVPQFVVVEGGEFLGKVDLAWPEARLVVEYEGPHHFDVVKAAEDDARYAALRAAGWRVIRLANADLRDLAEVVRRIQAALADVA